MALIVRWVGNSRWTASKIWEDFVLPYNLSGMCQIKCNIDRCKGILARNKYKQKMNRTELQEKDFEKDLEETTDLAQEMVQQ